MADVHNNSNASTPPRDVYFRLLDLRCDLFNTTICHVTALLWYVPYVLLVLGTVCNTLSFMTLSRRGVRGLTASIYLRFLAVMDTLVLWCQVLRDAGIVNTGYDIADRSDVVCKLVEWISLVSVASSAWLLVAVSLERLVVTKFLMFKSKINKRSTMCVASGICVIFALYFGNALFGFGLVVFEHEDRSGNITKIVHIEKCSFVSEGYFLFYVHIGSIILLLLVSVLPTVLITISNAFIIITLRNQQRKIRPNLNETSNVETIGNIEADKRIRTLTKMLVVVSGYFIVSLFPFFVHDIVVQYLSQSITNKDLVIHQLLRCIFFNIACSNYCVNFFLFLKRAPIFAREWTKLKSDLRRYAGRAVPALGGQSSNATGPTTRGPSTRKGPVTSGEPGTSETPCTRPLPH